MSRSWTKKDTKRFILLVEASPELWNVPSAAYKNRVKRGLALTNLAAQFDTTTIEIRRKLHNLRTQLNSELRKNKRRESGCVDSEISNTKWEFFDALKFMIPTIKSNENREVQEPPNGNLEVSMCAESSSSSNSIPNKPREYHETIEKPLEVPIMNKSDDDAQIFGDFVASSMRNLRSDNRRRLMRRKIQAAILEVEELDELDQLERGPASMHNMSRVHRDGAIDQIEIKYENLC